MVTELRTQPSYVEGIIERFFSATTIAEVERLSEFLDYVNLEKVYE